jgi:hypothetical protein
MNVAKGFLEQQEGFKRDQEINALYVVICTVEAAVAFDFVAQLSDICAELYDKQSKAIEEVG